MKNFIRIALLSAVGIGLVACSTTGSSNANDTAYYTDANGNRIILDPFNPQSPLYQEKSVYFGYDQYTVSPQYQNILQLHATYLSRHPQQKVRISGNTDARGSVEYNLGLGQRRSVAVRNILVQYGASPLQIEAISFGKSKPKAFGHTEQDYAENRRADITYIQ
ncbi:OmpA family protein [Basilea psittacipulmonis]|uniref:Peptidoglycan-associated lipoprotein n=1 Tax=Basilea psittacipulmonis DSM 24701 TaxID=1072685 RepID=A0A077DI94_9BURK|nr:OmpA family protein [Basilea psittacipulmonis]AIL32883.1 membrane protein [Basilea psittacipulmonis DSM 24701]